MSVLSNRYGLSEQDAKKMMQDGFLSTKWLKYSKIYEEYLIMKASGRTRTQMYLDIADKLHTNERTVKDVILRLDKI